MELLHPLIAVHAEVYRSLDHMLAVSLVCFVRLVSLILFCSDMVGAGLCWSETLLTKGCGRSCGGIDAHLGKYVR